MSLDYVSPIDERVRPPEPLAERPTSLEGAAVVLLDINKNRGAELLDRLQLQLERRGARVTRMVKEIFSRPASAAVIEDVVRRGQLTVVALAD